MCFRTPLYRHVQNQFLANFTNMLETMFTGGIAKEIEVTSSRYAGSRVSDEKEQESRYGWVDSSKVSEKVCFC